MTALEPGTIRNALDLARKHNLDEVELRSGDDSFVGTLLNRRTVAPLASPAFDTAETSARTVEVTSTTVGYIHRVDLAPGSPIEAGGTVAVVEALGLANDVASPRGGILREWTVEDGQAVQFGQVVAILEAGE